jgi:hypothetical protein
MRVFSHRLLKINLKNCEVVCQKKNNKVLLERLIYHSSSSHSSSSPSSHSSSSSLNIISYIHLHDILQYAILSFAGFKNLGSSTVVKAEGPLWKKSGFRAGFGTFFRHRDKLFINKT